MRLPRREHLLGLGEAVHGPDDEQTVVQGQLDEVDDQLAVVEDERSMRVYQPRFPVALDRGLPFDERTVCPSAILAPAGDSAIESGTALNVRRDMTARNDDACRRRQTAVGMPRAAFPDHI